MKNFKEYLRRAGSLAASVLTIGLLFAPSALAATSGSVDPWSTNTNTLPQGVQSAAVVTANGYVYVMGGINNGTVLDTVYYAKLNSDGSVGTWSTNTNALPQVVWSPGAITANGYVYVMAGNDNGAALDTVYYAKLNSDGSVGTWNTNTNTLPQGGIGSTAVTANGYVYVMGGEDTGNWRNAVYYAKLNSDGSVGTWSTNTNALPQDIMGATSVTANGYIYVMGGNDNGTVINTVYYAKLNSDGSVGTWSTNTNALPQDIYQGSSVTTNGYVYYIGGYGSPNPSDITYYAKLNSDGSVGTWSTNTNALPQKLWSASSITANGYVYVIGGVGGGAGTALDTVYYAQFTPDPTTLPGGNSSGSGITAPSSGSSSPTLAPNTGYGTPAQSDPVVIAFATGAIVTVSIGALLLYKQRKASRA